MRASGRPAARYSSFRSLMTYARISACCIGMAATLSACSSSGRGSMSTNQVAPGTRPLASGPLVPERGVLFGAWVQPKDDWSQAGDERAIAGLEHQIGRNLAVNQLYVRWMSPLPLGVVRWDYRRGTVPMISWGGANTDAISSGRYDRQIRATAEELRDLGQPILLRWFPEMDGASNRAEAISAQSFIGAWRHIHAIFEAAGATKVAWVWCPTASGFRSGVAPSFYPGARYVDWVCADGYNWAPQLAGAKWTSFVDIFSAFYRWGLASGKPLMVGEFGALEGQPGQKATWLAQAANALEVELPAIRAVVYFDSDHDGFDWAVSTSRSALAAFRAFASDPYFEAVASGRHSGLAT